MEDNPLLDRLRDTRLPKKPTRSSDAIQNQADEKIESALRQGAFDKLSGAGKPQDPDNAPKKQPPLTAGKVGSIAEQRIQAAIEDGMFDNLPGMGKPLDLYDDAHVPADMRLAFRLMKGKGFGAPWMDSVRDYQREIQRYAVWRQNNRERWERLGEVERAALRRELEERIKILNTTIHSINAAVPLDSMRLGLLVYERELQTLTGA